MKVEIKIAGKGDASEWDKIVDESPHGTLFHKWKWLRIMEKYSGAKLHCIMGTKGDELIGLYPIFVKKKFGFGFVFSPPPHLSVLYLGPVIANYEKMKQSRKESAFNNLQKEFEGFLSGNLKADYVNIMTPPNLMDSRPYFWNGYNVRLRFNYLNCISDENVFWSNMEKKLRQNISRAKREGVQVETGGPKEMRQIYSAMIRRYNEQNKRVKVPIEYLLDLQKEFSKNMRIYVALFNGEFVTGVIDLCYKNKISSWVGNPKSKLTSLNANDLVNWTSIEWGCKNGYKYYETMGAAGNERLHSYYSKFNPRLSVCYGATKYSSFLSKFFEFAYFRIVKPLEGGGGERVNGN